ncbi:MAG: polymer-forming cytoskeletal protein [Acidobacteria bacterium]|nr:polymer-forming cytoskeletal protein [Acidobacteriota bacterium]
MENKPFPVPTEGFVNIGATIFFKGEIQGNEDLIIEGEIEGKINLTDHNLHLGPKSRVRAEIYAKTITIEGDVRGDVFASERLVIKKSGRLNGNIVAPRLVLEDGARFKGTIDMDKHVEPPKIGAGSSAGAVSLADSREKNRDLELS